MLAASPEVEISLILPTAKGRGNLNNLLRRIDDSLTGAPWEAIIVGNQLETSFSTCTPTPPPSCKRLVYQRDRTCTTALPIDKLLSPMSKCIAVMEGERLGQPQLLPGMLNLLETDDADLVVAYRRSTEHSIETPPEDTEFAADLAKALIGISHADWRQLPSWQFLMRRQLLSRVRSLSGQRFGAFLDLLRSGKAPWRIVELPLGS